MSLLPISGDLDPISGDLAVIVWTLLEYEVDCTLLRSGPVGDVFSLLQLHCAAGKQKGHSCGQENGWCS